MSIIGTLKDLLVQHEDSNDLSMRVKQSGNIVAIKEGFDVNIALESTREEIIDIDIDNYFNNIKLMLRVTGLDYDEFDDILGSMELDLWWEKDNKTTVRHRIKADELIVPKSSVSGDTFIVLDTTNLPYSVWGNELRVEIRHADGNDLELRSFSLWGCN